MFKHHDFALQVHDITMSGGPSAVTRPTASAGGTPASTTAVTPDGTTTPAPPAPGPAAPPIPPDYLAVSSSPEVNFNNAPTLAPYAPAAGDEINDIEAVTPGSAAPAGAANPADGKMDVPEVPSGFDPTNREVKGFTDATAAQQKSLVDQFEKLNPDQQKAAMENGYKAKALEDGIEGPGTRASANALAVVQNKAASDHNAKVDQAAAEKATMDQAAAAEKTTADQAAATEKATADQAAADVQAIADRAAAAAKAAEDGDRLTQADTMQTVEGAVLTNTQSKAVADLAAARPDLVEPAFIDRLAKDNPEATVGLMNKFGGKPSERAQTLDKLPAATRESMIKQINSGKYNTDGEERMMGELTASLSRAGGQAVLERNPAWISKEFLGNEGLAQHNLIAGTSN